MNNTKISKKVDIRRRRQ